MKTLAKYLVVVVMAGLLISSLAAAQGGGGANRGDDFGRKAQRDGGQRPGWGGRGFGPGGPGGPDLEDSRRHLEQLRMLKMLELLDLSEDQEMVFISAFHRLHKSMRSAEAEKRLVVAQMAEGLAADTLNDAQIYRLVEQVKKLDQSRLTHLERLYDEVKSILTAEQLGKLVVFQERFEQEMLKHIKAFHDRMGSEPSLEPGQGGPDREPNNDPDGR